MKFLVFVLGWFTLSSAAVWLLGRFFVRIDDEEVPTPDERRDDAPMAGFTGSAH